MKILLHDIKNLLDEKLTMSQRGLMVTILLLKDPDPKITLAKVKAKVKMSEVKEDLMTLHKAGYIKWSGYNNAIKALDKKKSNPDVEEVILFMNELYGRKFSPTSEQATKALRERLKEYDKEAIKEVVANRWMVWKDDSVMEKHLNPQTIFRPSKFEKYFEEVSRTREGASLVNAKRIDLKEGQQITYELAQQLIDDDVYGIKTYSITGGKRSVTGSVQKLYGANLKQLLKIQNNRLKRGDQEEFHYLYHKSK